MHVPSFGRATGLVLLAALCVRAETLQLSLEEKEEFLTTARIISRETLAEGVTGSTRAKMSDGGLSHDAHIQTVDIFKSVFTSSLGTELNFRDSYKMNVAAYRLAKLLGLGHMVPPAVSRKLDGVSGAYSWWVDNAQMTERERYFDKKRPPNPNTWSQQMFIVRLFDQLIYNVDRNLGNLVIDTDWNLHMIDHTRSFRLHRRLKNPENLRRCDRQLLESLNKLDSEALNRELKPMVGTPEINAILARRNEIVKLFETKIERTSEVAVLYDYLSTR
jgi:hypothetical protein